MQEFLPEIRHLFNYNIENDQQAVHPQKVCGDCRRKLVRVKKKKEAFSTSDTLISFDPCDIGCRVCSKFKTKRTKGFSLTENHDLEICPALLPDTIREVAGTFGYIDLSGYSTEYEVFLGLVKIIDAIPVVVFNIAFTGDNKWCIFRQRHKITSDNYLTRNQPDVLTTQNVMSFFSELDKIELCSGHEGFESLIKHKIDVENCVLKGPTGNPNAEIQGTGLERISDLTTIRSVTCEVVVKGAGKCQKCKDYQDKLQKVSQRQSRKEEGTPEKNTPNINLTRGDLLKKSDKQQKEIRALEHRISSMKQFISKLVDEDGFTIDEKLSGM